MPRLTHPFRARGMRLAHAAVRWDAAVSAPSVLARLAAEDPGILRLLERLRSGLPVQQRFAWSFDSGRYCRPPGHNRAFYMDLNNARTGDARGVLAFKGTEVMATNFRELLDGLDDRFDLATQLPMLEWFPLGEQKVPGALLLDEALDEAAAAATFQTAYLAAHGELARVPVPLLVFGWDREVARAVQAGLESHLSRRAARATKMFARSGLGAYVYHYPTLPIRVRQLARYLIDKRDVSEVAPLRRSYPQRRARIEAITRPSDVVNRWLELFTDMLVLGFFPVTLSHQPVGQSVREQNAVIDGGFVDVDSLQRFSRVRDDHEFHATLVQSLRELSETVYAFMSESLDGPRPGTRGGCAAVGSAAHLVGPHVWMAVRERLLERRARGATLDLRLAAALVDEDPVARLDVLLTKMFPGVAR
jgi:hypothetical protein